ncbi:hypothetical protein T265_14768 [Opisthorchis viverrini]|uniref:Uncharacterized protein n=1 Tax=Opisthorchis viverrini TaxID=6198 RepID=A0A074Z6Q2_OPIVI|nr:hypothetical protein T265_14768 [Opisthorchis viverrini]KER22866.1 hypothetical protein T265_14768 [Opisthorchis viverrini]
MLTYSLLSSLFISVNRSCYVLLIECRDQNATGDFHPTYLSPKNTALRPPGTTFEFPNLFKTKRPSSVMDVVGSTGATDDTTSKSSTDSDTVTSSPSETKPPISHKKLPSWFIR